MQTQTVVSVFLPIAVGFIMLTLGMSLTLEDFRRVVRFPKPVLVGLIVQIALLPLFAYALCRLFEIPPDYQIGIMMLAASPGGSSANIFSHLAGGDVALNLTLTAINAATAIVFFPLIVSWAIQHFSGESLEIGPQFAKFVEVVSVILVPVTIGMAIHAKYPEATKRREGFFRKFSIAFLAVICIGAILKERQAMATGFVALGGVLLLFNVGSMIVGYLLPRFLKLSRPQSIAIAMELGIHNTTFALFVALTVLKSFPYALPAAVYGVMMYFPATAMALYFKRKTAP